MTALGDEEAHEGSVDSDVLAEKNRVKQLMNEEVQPEAITVMGLKKDYIIQAPRRCCGRKRKQEEDEEEAADNIFDLLEPDHEKEDADHGIKRAVRGISFSLKKDECFILLGVNGAGKTTTFKCLTSEELFTEGKIMINGKPLGSLMGNESNNLVGYCP